MTTADDPNDRRRARTPRYPVGRRRVLGAVAGVLAGCLGDGDADGASGDDGTGGGDGTGGDDGTDGDSADDGGTEGGDGDGNESANGSGSDGDGDATASPTTAPTDDGDLDLREANVTDVAFERSNGAYRFSVTLYHDDDGEDGYANWWQVESPSGDRLGRRDLLHAHGTREFTRSETIEIPEGTACVVVRGHDQTHGYGGRAMLVNVETGATEAVRQGPEPESFAETDCP